MWCDCHRYCKGGKYIGRATWYTHVDYRPGGCHFLVASTNNVVDSDSESDNSSSHHSDPVSPHTISQPDLLDSTDDRPLKRRRIAENLDSEDDELDISIVNIFKIISCCFPYILARFQSFDDAASSRSSSPELDADCDPGSLADLSPSEDEETEDVLDTKSETADDSDNLDPVPARIEDIQITIDFIKMVKEATLSNGGLDDDCIERLINPIQEELDISDPDLRFSLDLFLATSNSSERTYNEAAAAARRRHPDPVLTHHEIKKKVAEMSGVVPIRHDMCPNTCMAYTGPFAERDTCKFCGTARFDEHGVAREFYTIPLGPQLQALFRSPEGARDMHYRAEETERILEELTETGGVIEVHFLSLFCNRPCQGYDF